MLVKVKICGITNEYDALLSAELGVDAIGFVFSESKRYIDPVEVREIIYKLPPFITTVGVFVDEERGYVEEVLKVTGVDVIQFHGEESPEYCASFGKRYIKRVKVRGRVDIEFVKLMVDMYENAAAILLDPGGGEGKCFDWTGLTEFSCRKKIIIAGGLTPDNVGELLRVYVPYAVDVSSGVEICTGKKDREKIKSFVEKVRECGK